MSNNPYIIAGGWAGVDRLKVLAEATWPASVGALRRYGVGPGMRGLDVGCGVGERADRIASEFGKDCLVVGIDMDLEAVTLAQSDSRRVEFPHVSFIAGDATACPDLGTFDLIYCRFLLSHLRNPESLLSGLRKSLRSGGILLVEDVDFSGHFSFPKSSAFDRYVEMYTLTAQKNGADPLIGPKLASLLVRSGYNEVDVSLTQPVFMNGPGKLMASLTWANIRESVVASGLIDSDGAVSLDLALGELTRDGASLISLPRIFQASGRRA
ncbi:MAG: class I SAM-dependent methyltransferase [Oligoflexia bacterium]